MIIVIISDEDMLIIYIRCKVDVIDDTEGLRILCVLRISPYSVRMRENTDQNNFEYGHLLRSDCKSKSTVVNHSIV